MSSVDLYSCFLGAAEGLSGLRLGCRRALQVSSIPDAEWSTIDGGLGEVEGEELAEKGR